MSIPLRESDTQFLNMAPQEATMQNVYFLSYKQRAPHLHAFPLVRHASHIIHATCPAPACISISAPCSASHTRIMPCTCLYYHRHNVPRTSYTQRAPHLHEFPLVRQTPQAIHASCPASACIISDTTCPARHTRNVLRMIVT